MNINNKKLIDTLTITCEILDDGLTKNVLASDIDVTRYFKALRKLGLEIRFSLLVLSDIVCLYSFTQKEFDYMLRRLKLVAKYTNSEYPEIIVDIMLQLMDKDKEEQLEALNSCYMSMDSDIDHIEDKNGNDYILVRKDDKVSVYFENKRVENDLYCFILSENGIKIIGERDKARVPKDKLKIFIKRA